MIHFFTILLIFSLVNSGYCGLEDDFDSVLDLLFDGIEQDLEYPDNADEEPPKLQNDKWLCGDCNNLETLATLYQEENVIEYQNSWQNNNQVSLSVEGMQCITIFGDSIQDLNVRRVSGACSGDYVNLEVSSNGDNGAKFNVEVFG